MSQKHKHSAFDEQFKQKLDGFEMHGSDELWENISNDFPKIDSEKKERKRLIFFRWLTSGLILLLLSTVAFYEWKLNSLQENIQSQIQIANQEQEDRIVEKIKKLHQLTDSTPFSSITNAESEQQDFNNNQSRNINTTETSLKQQVSTQVPLHTNTDLIQNSIINQMPLMNDKNDGLNQSYQKKSIGREQSEKTLQTETTPSVQHKLIHPVNRNSTGKSHPEIELKPLTIPSIDTRALSRNSEPRNIDPLYVEFTSPQPEEELAEEDHDDENKIKNDRFSILMFGSPDYTFRTLKNNQVGEHLTTSQQEFNANESGALSFSFGTRLAYRIGKNISFFTGASYSKYTQSFDPNANIALLDSITGVYTINTSLGTVQFQEASEEHLASVEVKDDKTIVSYSSIQQMSVLSIPLQLQYNYDLNTKHRLFFHSGLSFNFILDSRNEVQFKGEHSSNKSYVTKNGFEGLKDFYYGASFGIGYTYQLSKNWSLVMNPVFNTALTPINKNNGVKSYPYSIGLNTGIKLSL